MRESEALAGRPPPNIGPWRLTGDILKQDGVPGLFRGLTATREMPGYFFFFLAYEATRHVLTPVGKMKDQGWDRSFAHRQWWQEELQEWLSGQWSSLQMWSKAGCRCQAQPPPCWPWWQTSWRKKILPGGVSVQIWWYTLIWFSMAFTVQAFRLQTMIICIFATFKTLCILYSGPGPSLLLLLSSLPMKPARSGCMKKPSSLKFTSLWSMLVMQLWKRTIAHIFLPYHASMQY